MDTHKNAPLTPKGREAMVRSVVEGGVTKAAAKYGGFLFSSLFSYETARYYHRRSRAT